MIQVLEMIVIVETTNAMAKRLSFLQDATFLTGGWIEFGLGTSGNCPVPESERCKASPDGIKLRNKASPYAGAVSGLSRSQ